MTVKVPTQVYPVKVVERKNTYSENELKTPFQDKIVINREKGTYLNRPLTKVNGSENMPTANGLMDYKYK